MALARANQSNWADAGKLFEQLYDSYPKLAPYHAYNAARCRLRRSDYAGAIEWAGKVAKGSVPEAEADLIRIDALRSLNRWDEALAALESHLGRFPGGLRHAEVLYKKAEATEKARAGKDARAGQQVSKRSSISTGGSGRRRRSRPGASAPATGSSRSRPVSRRPRRRWSARAARPSWSRAG